MANAPDVRVRLSAEGTAEVIAALRKIQAETATMSTRAKSNIGGLNSILGSTTRLLTTLGATVSVAALVGLARAGADAADRLSEASQIVGTTDERLAGLAATAKLNGVEFESLVTTTGIFAKNLAALRSGSPQAAAAFDKIHLSVKNFAGQDTVEALETVAKKFAEIPDGAEKTAAALEIAGKKGAQLIPTFNELGRVGLKQTIEDARKLGLILDSSVIAQAGRVADELDIMKQQAQNAATAFTAGLGPAIHQAFLAINEDVDSSSDGWEDLGKIIGVVIRGATFILVGFADTVSLVLGTIATDFTTLAFAAGEAINGNFANAVKALKIGFSQTDKDFADFVERNKKRLATLTAPGATPAPRPTGTGTVDTGEDAAKRRLQISRTLNDQELAITQARLRAQEATEERRYALGITSLATFYARRRQIVQEGLDAELKAQAKIIALEAKNPDADSRTVNIAKAKTEITKATLEAQTQIADLTVKESTERERITSSRLDIENKIRTLQGQGHEARMAEIQEEVIAAQKVVAAAGGDDDAQVREGLRLQQALQAGEAFDESVRRFNEALAKLNSDRAAIQNDVAAAKISEVKGQEESLALDEARLPVLRDLAAASAEIARQTGNPENIAAAEDLADKVAEIGASASASAVMLANLNQGILEAAGGGLTTFLSAGVQGFQNLGQAGVAALAQIGEAVNRLAIQIIVSRILEIIGAGVVPKIGITSNEGTIDLPGKADGGPIGGVGTGTSDSNLLWGSKGEFMVREAVVSRPGNLAFLKAFNAGRLALSDLARHSVGGLIGATAQVGPTTQVARSPIQRLAGGGLVMPAAQMGRVSIQRLAGGGLVSGSATPATATFRGSLEVGTEPGLVVRHLKSREGEDAVLEILARRRSAALAAIGGGRVS